MVCQSHDVRLRKNNIGDHVVERTALPDHLIKNVAGKIVFQAQHIQVCLVNFGQQYNIGGYRWLLWYPFLSRKSMLLHRGLHNNMLANLLDREFSNR